MNTSRSIVNVFEEAFRLLGLELAYLAPRIIVAALITALIIVIGIVISKAVNKLLTIANVDELVKPYIEKYGLPFNPRTIVNILITVGLAVLALYSITAIVTPQHVGIVNVVVDYIGRVVSAAVLLIVIVSSLSMVFDKIRIERGIKGFAFLITMLLSLAILIDVTNISPDIRSSIVWGLSLGIGVSIGVFTAWYFFEEVIREKLKESTELGVQDKCTSSTKAEKQGE